MISRRARGFLAIVLVVTFSAKRGFSAVELLNFFGLAAILSAIGMYALALYVRHAKTTEAIESVGRLGAAAAEFYNGSDATQPTGATPEAAHAMRHFPPGSRAPVPEETLSVRGRRYQSNLADWDSSPWRDLHFSIVQPQCYRYSFESQGAGASAVAVVTADGDLDGDGERSTYSLEIAPNAALEAIVAPQITRKDPEE